MRLLQVMEFGGTCSVFSHEADTWLVATHASHCDRLPRDQETVAGLESPDPRGRSRFGSGLNPALPLTLSVVWPVTWLL